MKPALIRGELVAKLSIAGYGPRRLAGAGLILQTLDFKIRIF